MVDPPFIRYIHEQSSERLVDGLVDKIERALMEGISRRGTATLVSSGGLTPMPLLEKLGRRSLPWSDVTVTVTDERCVPSYDPQSNAGMVRRSLMRGSGAALARLVGLHGDTAEDSVQPKTASDRIASLRRPFDFVLLGMGEDGHFASLFPGQAALEIGLEPMGKSEVIVGSGKGTRRVSLTLSTLLDTRNLAVLILGGTKREVLERAANSLHDSAFELPIRALLRQRQTPVEVHWAPVKDLQ